MTPTEMDALQSRLARNRASSASPDIRRAIGAESPQPSTVAGGPAPAEPQGGMERREPTPAAQRASARREIKDLHEPLLADCRRRGWKVIHSRPDKPSTIAKGFPDFTVIHRGRCVCVEFKAHGGRLSKEQEVWVAELQEDETPVLVTSDLGAAITFIRYHLEPEGRP